MIKPEVIEFCEDHKISIRKFLQENYSIIRVTVLKDIA